MGVLEALGKGETGEQGACRHMSRNAAERPKDRQSEATAFGSHRKPTFLSDGIRSRSKTFCEQTSEKGAETQ